MFRFATTSSRSKRCGAAERAAITALALGVVLLTPARGAGQTFSQRGSAEAIVTAHPQTNPPDDTHLIADSLVRWSPSIKAGAWRFDASFDARMDSHRQTERSFEVTFWDRTTQRPPLAIGSLSASWARGPVTLVLGKQFLRWGKTDIVVPTDRFAPRDYTSIIEPDLLGVTAARLTLSTSSDSLDIAVTPRLTPSRAPLLGQRWAAVPAAARTVTLVDEGAVHPRDPQIGIRWNHLGSRLEYSLSAFRGFNHLPWFEATVVPSPPHVEVRRRYAQLTAVGADLAAPLSWFIIKAEASWFASETPEAGEYLLYVVQVERQFGEWLLIAGYAGEHEHEPATPFRFAPDRGLARAVVARGTLTLAGDRSLTIEGVVRQNGDGFYGRVEYSHPLAPQWRTIATLVGFGGDEEDFLGRYRRNSFARLTLRFSF